MSRAVSRPTPPALERRRSVDVPSPAPLRRALRPTAEQEAAVEAFRAGGPLKTAAFAGAGKTSTLRMMAEARTSPSLYLAFNRAIATEARGMFPGHVDCRTTHAIAYRAVAPTFGDAAKLTGRILARELAEVMDCRDRRFGGSFRLTAVQQAHLIQGTVRRFCQSADGSITARHVPMSGGLASLGDELAGDLRRWAAGKADRLWLRMNDPGDAVPLGHDGYLKRWALGRPRLNAGTILLDEAQDTNGVVLGVLAAQPAQIVYVGDRHQQIYAWRGAVNAMQTIAGCTEVGLTQSFRFGEAIAVAATAVLAHLGETRPLRGNPDRNSAILEEGRAHAVLTRTNAALILEALQALGQGLRVAVVGGTEDLQRLLRDVFALKEGHAGSSPEFFGFASWVEVVAFAETEEGEELRGFVQLVAQHGERRLWRAVKNIETDERSADLVLSTAHKAKGREWDAVRLAEDFGGSRIADANDAQAERRLFYVAMTRARRTLIVAPRVLGVFVTSQPPENGASS